MHEMQPIDALQWAAEHADQLQPPECNKSIFKGDQLECMLVAGPNDRTDFHINPTEEFFYQIEGRLVLTIMQEVGAGIVRNEILIEQGKCFLLPSRVPHNPRREEGSLGLVIERRRPEGVEDKTVWYCKQCNAILQEYSFQCKDLDSNILDAIKSNSLIANQLCSRCQTQ
mgnify:CR=1 FL=1